mmetsp:Transcript_10025/g.21688  ORF Transcript_10025/g.21688 Transcript_10025/m.21688 type:complete len:204 (-) Transcript_10025:61-672(-)
MLRSRIYWKGGSPLLRSVKLKLLLLMLLLLMMSSPGFGNGFATGGIIVFRRGWSGWIGRIGRLAVHRVMTIVRVRLQLLRHLLLLLLMRLLLLLLLLLLVRMQWARRFSQRRRRRRRRRCQSQHRNGTRGIPRGDAVLGGKVVRKIATFAIAMMQVAFHLGQVHRRRRRRGRRGSRAARSAAGARATLTATRGGCRGGIRLGR